jgi:hypothetical protein
MTGEYNDMVNSEELINKAEYLTTQMMCHTNQLAGLNVHLIQRTRMTTSEKDEMGVAYSMHKEA